ncbi:MAG: YfhO family protein, partial [Methanocorpusculum sp.]|nr:YfhO family protein [Methanocorpusculum sp.]
MRYFKKYNIITAALAYILSVGIMFFLFAVKKYAPFGESSLAVMDATYQYLDFFGYLKNVFLGEDSIFYSFHKMLGGGMEGTVAYYLSSPFNLLLFFFDKASLPAFFDLLVALKLGVAAAAFSIFLLGRHEGEARPFTFSDGLWIVLLALCYSLCQYSIAQSSNIMWLDGVVMLPLMMLGVFYTVTGDRRKYLLSVFTAVSILANWYTAGFNGFFSIVWFVFEFFLSGRKANFRSFLLGTGRYCLFMLFGVMLSAVLFLPAIASMAQGSRGGIDLGLLRDMTFDSPFPALFTSYRPGAISSFREPAIYCGIIPVIGLLFTFFTEKISLRKKLTYLGMLVFMVLMFFWNPMRVVFSMFRTVESYWYRSGYIGSFLMVFIASEFLLGKNRKKGVLLAAAGLIFTVVDMGNHASLLIDHYHLENASSFAEYSMAQEAQLDEIHDRDDSLYRISQTSNRGGSSQTV